MEKFLTILVALVLFLAASALGGWLFMLLWNWLVPLFWASCPILTFWQAWGVTILLGFIGGFFRGSKS